MKQLHLPDFPTASDPRALSAEAFTSNCDPAAGVQVVDTERWVVCAIPRMFVDAVDMRELAEALLSDMTEIRTSLMSGQFHSAGDAIDPSILHPLQRTASVLHLMASKIFEEESPE